MIRGFARRASDVWASVLGRLFVLIDLNVRKEGSRRRKVAKRIGRWVMYTRGPSRVVMPDWLTRLAFQLDSFLLSCTLERQLVDPTAPTISTPPGTESVSLLRLWIVEMITSATYEGVREHCAVVGSPSTEGSLTIG